MPSGSAIGPVQTAISAVLKADATLPTLSLTKHPTTGATTTVVVVNDSSAALTNPYVMVSKPTEKPWNTFGGATAGIGRKVIARVHVYSQYNGDLEATRILNHIVSLLDMKPESLTVSGFTPAMVEYEQGRILVEAIDKIETRHGIAEFAVSVQ